jgi:hypothetical protein
VAIPSARSRQEIARGGVYIGFNAVSVIQISPFSKGMCRYRRALCQSVSQDAHVGATLVRVPVTGMLVVVTMRG